jgi:hypothetical protein
MYVRSLSLAADRVGYDAAAYGDVRWHEQQADAVHGLCSSSETAVHHCDFRFDGLLWYHGEGHALPPDTSRLGCPFILGSLIARDSCNPTVAAHCICAGCQVWTVLNHENRHTKVDVALLMLEHMRMIEIGRSWAVGILAKYDRPLARLGIHPFLLAYTSCGPSFSFSWHPAQPTSEGETVT